MELLGYKVVARLVFWTVFIPTSNMWVSQSLHPHQHLVLFLLFILAILIDVLGNLIVSSPKAPLGPFGRNICPPVLPPACSEVHIHGCV